MINFLSNNMYTIKNFGNCGSRSMKLHTDTFPFFFSHKLLVAYQISVLLFSQLEKLQKICHFKGLQGIR